MEITSIDINEPYCDFRTGDGRFFSISGDGHDDYSFDDFTDEERETFHEMRYEADRLFKRAMAGLTIHLHKIACGAKYMNEHASGWPIVERLDRNVVVQRKHDYAVGHLYNPETGSWAWGHYGLTREGAHELLIELCYEDIKNGRSETCR